MKWRSAMRDALLRFRSVLGQTGVIKTRWKS